MYIVISGNTGAGKTTLGHCLYNELKNEASVEYINERVLHHELVQQMFDHPQQYAFLIQMNFLLQRTLKIKQLLEKGQVFLMERSLSEDFLFAYRHCQLGTISSDEFEIYKQFWEECSNKVPPPSLYIYLHSSDSSFFAKRIIKGYVNGTRSRELSNTDLLEYTDQLNLLYEKWFTELKGSKIQMPAFRTDLVGHKNFAKIRKLILTKIGDAE